MYKRSIFDGNPILAQLGASDMSTAGPPVVGQSVPQPVENPFQKPLNTGAELLQQMLQQHMPSTAAPPTTAGAPVAAAQPGMDFTSGLPQQLQKEMFQNPAYDANNLKQMQAATQMLMSEATSGNYDNNGKLNTRGRIRKYADSAGQIIQGLGGLGAAFGPVGAAKGFNAYLEQAQKQSIEKQKMQAEQRKLAIEGMDKLAEVMGKSRQYTVKDVENILKAKESQATVDKLVSDRRLVDEKIRGEEANTATNKNKSVTEIMDAIRSGAAGQKDVAGARATNELGDLREAQQKLTQEKGNTEVTKQDVNKEKGTQIKAGTELKKAQTAKTVEETGLVKNKQSTQVDVQHLLKAKTEAIKAKASGEAMPQDPGQLQAHVEKMDTILNKGLPPGAVSDPIVQKLKEAMLRRGTYTPSRVQYILNVVKGMPKYQEKGKGSDGLTPLPGAQHG